MFDEALEDDDLEFLPVCSVDVRAPGILASSQDARICGLFIVFHPTVEDAHVVVGSDERDLTTDDNYALVLVGCIGPEPGVHGRSRHRRKREKRRVVHGLELQVTHHMLRR